MSPSAPIAAIPVRREEIYLAAALIGAAAACLLGGYELVRSPANTLFKAVYGKAGLPYVMAATPVGIIVALYIYGRLLTWLEPRRTLLATTLGSCLLIAGCFAGIRLKVGFAAVILYVVREAYVVLLIEQYWSFLNSTLGTGTAKKLNGPICAAGSLGAIGGATLVAHFAPSLGTGPLLLVGAAVTVPAALLTDLAYRFCGEPRPQAAEKAASDTLGLRLFRSHKVLALLLVIIVLSQVVSALLDLSFQGILQDQIPDADKQTAFSGHFYAGLNVAALVAQLVFTPLLLRYLPIGLVHVCIPLVHVASCAWLLGSTSLASAGTAYLLFKTLDYSIFRAGKELLYIPLPFDARYRAKEVIDVFGYRFGKGGISLLVAPFALAEWMFALGALVAAAAWTVLALPLGRSYSRKHQ